MQGKKWIAAALVCGFLLGQGTAPAQAGILGTVVKGGAVSLLVSQFADQLNSAINTLTAKYPISSDYATKVVPIITVGDGSYAGAAQVSGPKEQVDKCQAALQLEASFSGNLIPSAAIMKAFPGEKLSMDDLHTNGKFFQAVSFSGKHQAGLAAVVKGDVQVAPISDAILAAEINAGRVSKDDVKIIFASDPIPSEPMALRRDLPAEVKEKVKNFILSYDNAAYYKGVMGAEDKRFVECSIEDYKGIIDLNKALSSSK